MYNVTASLEGYEPATATVSVPKDGSGAVHAFALVAVGAAAATAATVDDGAAWSLPRRFGAFGAAAEAAEDADAEVRARPRPPCSGPACMRTQGSSPTPGRLVC
jgi:hypothetical protein